MTERFLCVGLSVEPDDDSADADAGICMCVVNTRFELEDWRPESASSTHSV